MFWKWAHDPRTRGKKQDYFADVANGELPQVSFVIPSYLKGHDEHPPAKVSVGMKIQRRLITALRESSAWNTSAFVLTYDEAGGYFDHVSPPQIDAYGLGIRVPTWVVSPYAKRANLEPRLYDHTSTLRFIERVFDLPTLASVNHLFDTETPGGPNNEAADGKHRPTRSARDGYSVSAISRSAFDFGGVAGLRRLTFRRLPSEPTHTDDRLGDDLGARDGQRRWCWRSRRSRPCSATRRLPHG